MWSTSIRELIMFLFRSRKPLGSFIPLVLRLYNDNGLFFSSLEPILFSPLVLNLEPQCRQAPPCVTYLQQLALSIFSPEYSVHPVHLIHVPPSEGWVLGNVNSTWKRGNINQPYRYRSSSRAKSLVRGHVLHHFIHELLSYAILMFEA